METETTQTTKFEVGKPYTLFSISSWLAHTMKAEIKVTREIDGRYTFKERGKRKEYWVEVDKTTVVFEGWDLPIHCDSEGNKFSGNARLNFVGDEKEVLDFVEKNNLNPELDKSYILVEKWGEGIVALHSHKTERYSEQVHFFGEMDLNLSNSCDEVHKKAFDIAETCGYFVTRTQISKNTERITLYGKEGEVFKLWFVNGKFKAITHSDNIKDAVQIPDGEGTGYGGYF